jgi:protein-L-isoaspartate(D-aspartate) O-methyltransferase
MNIVEKYQYQLLEQTQSLYHRTPISDETVRAYLATPRHDFVKRYREWGTTTWHEVRADNVAEHAATLYANRPLILFGDDDAHIPSTISQPSFVLHMLDLLQIQPGHSIFELGAGSGWNAALLGQLVRPDGHVYSLEIIPEIAATAMNTLDRLHINNVHVVAADGGEGHVAGAPYDRAIFTAGTYDLSHCFYDQIKDGGLLLIVMKNEGGGDTLFLLRKTRDYFESLKSMPCSFVQLRGKHQVDHLDPVTVDTIPEWAELQNKEVARVPFWWGGEGAESFLWRTLGIRSFLGITESLFRTFKTTNTDPHSQEEHYFGLWDHAHGSLVLAKEESLIGYGTTAAMDRLLQRVRQWVELGMPSTASFALRVYPKETVVTLSKNQWLVQRTESQFLWSLGR